MGRLWTSQGDNFASHARHSKREKQKKREFRQHSPSYVCDDGYNVCIAEYGIVHNNII